MTGPPRALATAAIGGAALAAALGACNGILGNEQRVLDQLAEGGPTTDAAGRGGNDAAGDDGGADAASCGAPVATDPHNCGRCRHDCLGGACTAGVCQPFTVASGLTTPDYPVVADRVAYWTSNNGDVFSCPVVGCTKPTKLMQIDAGNQGNPLPNGLDVHNGVVYVIGYYSASILSCPVTGCGQAPTTVVSGLDYPSRVAADDTNVFFLDANAGDLERCDLPTCTRRVRLAIGTPAWFKMTTDAATVYWVQNPNANPSNGTILRTPKSRELDGGGEVILSNRNPNDLAVRNGVLYMVENGTVTKITLAPGLPELPLAQGESLPAGVAVDDTDVYWVNLGDGAVRKCPQAGCAFKPMTLAPAQNTPKGPYVTADAVYWTEFNGGTFRGVAK